MELEENRKSLLKIDLRTKLILLFAASALLVGNVPAWAQWGVLSASLLLLLNYGYVKSFFTYFTVFVVMWCAVYFLKNVPPNSITMLALLICQVVLTFIPSVAIGSVFLRTTRISEIMAVSEKMKLPYQYAIPFAVIIRFFPTLTEEWGNIRMATKMRGIGTSLEYIIVPLLNSSMIISDELSAASLSRGLGSVKHRTNVCIVQMNITDWLISVAALVFLVMLYLYKN